MCLLRYTLVFIKPSSLITDPYMYKKASALSISVDIRLFIAYFVCSDFPFCRPF